jgi:serine/threonine protein kinase
VPDRDPPDQNGVVHASERARVTRLVLGDRRVICKKLLGRDAPSRLRHEVAMLERLRGVFGVAQLLDAPRYPGCIVLADAGRMTLDDVAMPLAVDGLIALAVGLARAVAAMHGRGVMHRGITPTNVVLGDAAVPCLVGFGSAMSLTEIRPEFAPHDEMVGTLAYLAPEQTGRIGAPTCTRWARRYMSWQRVRRRSGPVIRCS